MLNSGRLFKHLHVFFIKMCLIELVLVALFVHNCVYNPVQKYVSLFVCLCKIVCEDGVWRLFENVFHISFRLCWFMCKYVGK